MALGVEQSQEHKLSSRREVAPRRGGLGRRQVQEQERQERLFPFEQERHVAGNERLTEVGREIWRHQNHGMAGCRLDGGEVGHEAVDCEPPRRSRQDVAVTQQSQFGKPEATAQTHTHLTLQVQRRDRGGVIHSRLQQGQGTFGDS